MLPLDDPRWRSLQGGYGVLYDASAALRRLLDEGPSEELWEELTNELHHQGDVGQASYAALPWLVEYLRGSYRLDGDALTLIALIDLERTEHCNPKVREDLAEAYFAAIRSLPALLGSHPDQQWDEEVLRAAVTCIALARCRGRFARAYFELDRDTAGRWFSEEFGWDFDPK